MKDYVNSLDNILKAFAENHQHDKDELKYLLHEQGVDAEQLIKNSLEKIKNMQKEFKTVNDLI